MGYRLKRLDEPIFMAGPKPMRTEFGIHHRLESCDARFRIFHWPQTGKSNLRESFETQKHINLIGFGLFQNLQFFQCLFPVMTRKNDP